MKAKIPARLFVRSAAALTVAAAALAATVLPASAVTRTQKTFGKWLVTCTETDAGAKSCALSQQQPPAPNTRRPPLILNINGGKEKQTLVALVPIGVSLLEGVALNFGGSTQPTAMQYVVCGPRTCVARVPIDAKLLDTLKTQAKGVVNYVMANKKLVQLNVDFAGFKDAYGYWLQQLS